MLLAGLDLAPHTVLAAALIAVIVVVAVVVLRRLAARKPAFPFNTKPVLTDAELAFHRVLVDCLPRDTILLAKVRLADFLEVAVRGDEYIRHFGRISQKHSDFLLIDAATAEPVLAVELDDSSHRRSRRTAESDAFKDQAYRAAGLPILRIRAATNYDSKDVCTQLAEALERDISGPLRSRQNMLQFPDLGDSE